MANANELINFLPDGNKNNFKIVCESLRGNIDTRMNKLLQGQYHGILLAYAGLERVSYLEEGLEAMKKYANELTYMILPCSHFPPAAAQGALAIDTHQDNLEVQKILEKIHCPKTAQETQYEKELFQAYGGGCHLAVGINSQIEDEHAIIYQKGEVDGVVIDKVSDPHNELDCLIEKLKLSKSTIFTGMPKKSASNTVHDLYLEKTSLHKQTHYNKNAPFFMATKYCFSNLEKLAAEASQLPALFCSGVRSMMYLAEKGYWVNGACESVGETSLLSHKNSRSYNLFHQLDCDWNVLSHAEANSELGEIIPSYQRKFKECNISWEKELQECRIFYWASFYQYQMYHEKFSFLQKCQHGKNAIHTVGPGKTYRQFKDHNIDCLPLLSFKLLAKYFKGESHE